MSSSTNHTQVLSNFGGSMGLMTGFSMMSTFEIFIYIGLLLREKYILYRNS